METNKEKEEKKLILSWTGYTVYIPTLYIHMCIFNIIYTFAILSKMSEYACTLLFSIVHSITDEILLYM